MRRSFPNSVCKVVVFFVVVVVVVDDEDGDFAISFELNDNDDDGDDSVNSPSKVQTMVLAIKSTT